MNLSRRTPIKRHLAGECTRLENRGMRNDEPSEQLQNPL